MACYKPLTAYQCFDGSVVWSELRKYDIVRTLNLPCGQCVGCRLERSRQWAIRCMHEASLYDHNCFITLTYADKHLPSDRSLDYEHFQLFMKRFRKKFSSSKIRFYMCGEYGEQLGRPHYHACIFNFDFKDKIFWKKTSSDSKIFRSASLEELWSFGFSSIGDVNFQSAAYVARYIMKKVTGQLSDNHYEGPDYESGEIVNRRPEFNKMSLKPGIGYKWYKDFKSDVYLHDYVIVNGKKVRPPRFYDNKFKEEFPLEFDELALHRMNDAKKRYEDNSPERLAVKEKVTLAKLSKLPRTLV